MAYIVAGRQPDGGKTWATAETVEAAFILGSAWRAAGTREITVAAVIEYTATIQIVAGGNTYSLPVPDVPS